MSDLSRLYICVEKPLEHEKHVVKNLKEQSNSEAHFHKLRAAFFTQKLWPKGKKITISFVPNKSGEPPALWTGLEVMENRREPDGSSAKVDPIEYKIRDLSPHDAVKMVVKERIAPLVDLDLEFVEGNSNVRIGFNGDGGSWSLIGTDCLQSSDHSTMNFGWLDAATIMHEFGHLLGMIHEHDNPKGNPIEWNKPVLYQWAKDTYGWDKATVESNIIKRYDVKQLNASEFDPQSIMLYFFPAKLTLNHQATNINQRLSKEDMIYIHKIYQGKVNPISFHNKIYGSERKPFMYIIIFILILVLGYFLYKKYRK